MSDSPAKLPLKFFQSLQAGDCVQTWELLSQRSQQMFVLLLAKSWPAHSVEALTEIFSTGGSVAQLYWKHFRENIQLQTWLVQSYQQLGGSQQEAIIKATPSGVHLLIYQEAGKWKLGYIETFLEHS